MKHSEMKDAPWLGGWVIAAAAGLVGGAIAYVIGDLNLTQAAFVAVAVCVAVGLFMAMPAKAAPSRETSVAPAVKPAPLAVVEPVSANVVASPAMAEAAPAAAFTSVPVAGAAPTRTPRAAKPKLEVAANPVTTAAAKPAAAKAPRLKNPDGPERLSAPRNGKADNLKEIEGIGPALEKLCNSLGFYHFDQIAKWSDADVEWVDANMKNFKGRIVRDKWIAQSKIIVTEGLEVFRARAQTNSY